MQIHKVHVKFFASESASSVGYVSVFQRWIRERVLDELLIDVVDYSHVANGPEVALIGHESDYVLDRAQGKLGLLHVSKRSPGSNEEPLLRALKRAITACVLLERDSLTTAPLEFDSRELQIRVADRLAAPNSDATFERLLPALQATLDAFYTDTPYELERFGSDRELFGVAVSAPTAPPLRELLPRLGVAAP
jgi:hypothetical protein